MAGRCLAVNRPLQRARGSTWIEILVALGILGWTLAALGITVSLGWKRLAHGEAALVALDRAQACLASLEAGDPGPVEKGCPFEGSSLRLSRHLLSPPGLALWEIQVLGSDSPEGWALRRLGFTPEATPSPGGPTP